MISVLKRTIILLVATLSLYELFIHFTFQLANQNLFQIFVRSIHVQTLLCLINTFAVYWIRYGMVVQQF